MLALHHNAIFGSKPNIYSHHPSPFPRVGGVEKCEGNVNLHSSAPLFIWSITLLSKYSRTLLTTFLRFSRFRIFGYIVFWNKTPHLKIWTQLPRNFLKIFLKFYSFSKFSSKYLKIFFWRLLVRIYQKCFKNLPDSLKLFQNFF